MQTGPTQFETTSFTSEWSHLEIAFQTPFRDFPAVEQFKNPPIQEALLDIQVTLSPDLKLETLKGFHEGLETRFPEMQERVSWEQGFQIAGAGETQAIRSSRSVDGYLFVSKSEGKVVQARRDGFTFNKLKPYSNWETFNSEARELWGRYVSLVHPISVQRIALRYLNRISLPLPVRDLRDYCLLFPDLPPALPQGMSEFFLRVTLPAADAPCAANVTLTFEPPAPCATALNLILDNEASYVFGSLSVDTEAIWSKLTQLRDLKNKVFDASLTEETRKLFRQ
jgi:uncharacterized protein (TIGR04255 family)